MVNIDVMVPRFVWVQPFEVLEVSGQEKALAACETAGYDALYMPDIIEARIAAKKGSYVWGNGFTTLSLRATGRTKGGTPVVVYTHGPHYFSRSKNITAARELGLQNGAGVMPREAFYDLVDRDDNITAFVVDHHRLRKSSSDVIAVDEALEHPQTVPFLGGQDRAERYLPCHKEVYGKRIGNWHCDDLGAEPVGRLLVLGNGGNIGLGGCNFLYYSGRFLGEKRRSRNAVVGRRGRETLDRRV